MHLMITVSQFGKLGVCLLLSLFFCFNLLHKLCVSSFDWSKSICFVVNLSRKQPCLYFFGLQLLYNSTDKTKCDPIWNPQKKKVSILICKKNIDKKIHKVFKSKICSTIPLREGRVLTLLSIRFFFLLFFWVNNSQSGWDYYFLHHFAN